jgi:hypothetical protein
VRSFTKICLAGVLMFHADTVMDGQTDRHGEATWQHVVQLQHTYEDLSRLIPNLNCTYMRTDITEVVFPQNILISVRNARKIPTATRVRFQNAAMLFVSWIVALGMGSFVPRNLNRVTGLGKFYNVRLESFNMRYCSWSCHSERNETCRQAFHSTPGTLYR